MQGISIIIPSYNGKELLVSLLPLIIGACNNYDGETEIIVVEDGGTDETEEFIKEKFKQVKVFKLPQNHGYGYTCNYGVSQSKYEIIVILNNDVKVDKSFLNFIPQHFNEKEVFAVKIAIKPMDESNDISKDLLWWGFFEFKKGWLYTPFRKLPKDDNRVMIARGVAGGAAAFSKEKFTKLKGFDDLFLPFYAEETDLCYRALKRGWKIIYEPESIVWHKGRETISHFYKKGFVEMIGERNMYYLIWKNINYKNYLFQHFLFIPLRIIRGFLKGRIWPLLAFLKALYRLPKVVELRHIEQKETIKKDEEIFKFFK